MNTLIKFINHHILPDNMATIKINYKSSETINHNESQVDLNKQEVITEFNNNISTILQNYFGVFTHGKDHHYPDDKANKKSEHNQMFTNGRIVLSISDEYKRNASEKPYFWLNRLLDDDDNTEIVKHINQIKITGPQQIWQLNNAQIAITELRNLIDYQRQKDPDSKITYNYDKGF